MGFYSRGFGLTPIEMMTGKSLVDSVATSKKFAPAAPAEAQQFVDLLAKVYQGPAELPRVAQMATAKNGFDCRLPGMMLEPGSGECIPSDYWEVIGDPKFPYPPNMSGKAAYEYVKALRKASDLRGSSGAAATTEVPFYSQAWFIPAVGGVVVLGAVGIFMATRKKSMAGYRRRSRR